MEKTHQQAHGKGATIDTAESAGGDAGTPSYKHTAPVQPKIVYVGFIAILVPCEAQYSHRTVRRLLLLFLFWRFIDIMCC